MAFSQASAYEVFLIQLILEHLLTPRIDENDVQAGVGGYYGHLDSIKHLNQVSHLDIPLFRNPDSQQRTTIHPQEWQG